MYFQRRSWRVVALLLSSPAPPAQRRVRVVIVSHKRQQQGFGWLFLGQQRGIIRSSAEFIKLIHHEGCRLPRRLDRHRLGLRASVRPQVRVSRARSGGRRGSSGYVSVAKRAKCVEESGRTRAGVRAWATITSNGRRRVRIAAGVIENNATNRQHHRWLRRVDGSIRSHPTTPAFRSAKTRATLSIEVDKPTTGWTSKQGGWVVKYGRQDHPGGRRSIGFSFRVAHHEVKLIDEFRYRSPS